MSQPTKRRGCLQLMRDQAWGFVFGFLSLVVAFTSLILVIPQAAPIRAGIAQTFGNSTPTAALTSPTPTPKAISENLPIPCISTDCNTTPIQLTLSTITLDNNNNQTTLTFNVHRGCAIGTSFQTVELQDPAGKTYKGIVSDNSWSAETIIKVAVFDNLIMQKNVEYLLNVGISCGLYNDVFQAEYIKI